MVSLPVLILVIKLIYYIIISLIYIILCADIVAMVFEVNQKHNKIKAITSGLPICFQFHRHYRLRGEILKIV